MLKRLSVKNFAIIEDLTVDFKENMTVLTGETGAGKSLLIDTILLLLGERADNDMIRYGEKSASITGLFTLSDSLKEELAAEGINADSDITITREIQDSGRNKVIINNTGVTLQFLKKISPYLADIHVQNDTYRLFNPENYLEMLDPKSDKKFNKLINDYQKGLYSYSVALEKYQKIEKGRKNTLDRLEFLEYEKKELSALDLSEGIDTELEEKIAKLANFDKISNALNTSYQALNNEINPLDLIYEASKSLEKISEYDTKYQSFNEKLLDAYYVASEISDELAKDIKNLDYDEDELNLLNERVNDINKAKDKYKKTVSELIKYLEDITLEIDMATNYDEVLKENLEATWKEHSKLCEYSAKLHDYRVAISKNLAKAIITECMDLDLENTNFEVEFKEKDLSNPLDKTPFDTYGTDDVNFMITFNKGEPLKPLHKIASGGEMSRIMLAFKSYFSKTGKTDLMIFDEIDTGVSGVTAKKIADKMYQISKNKQVLCITHLPQVAAKGNYHKHIYKLMEKNRTHTEIKDLIAEERVEEIAMMLSGDKLSQYALLHAKELLENK